MIFCSKPQKFTWRNAITLLLLLTAGSILILLLIPSGSWFDSETDSNECFMWITSTDSLGENYNYNNGYTKKYGGLYFISPEGYPDETYQNLYAFVSPLFSDDLHSIEASKDMIRFTVLLTSNIGTDSSLVWTNGEKAPTGTYPTVQRQRQLDAHWYAITASD